MCFSVHVYPTEYKDVIGGRLRTGPNLSLYMKRHNRSRHHQSNKSIESTLDHLFSIALGVGVIYTQLSSPNHRSSSLYDSTSFRDVPGGLVIPGTPGTLLPDGVPLEGRLLRFFDPLGARGPSDQWEEEARSYYRVAACPTLLSRTVRVARRYNLQCLVLNQSQCIWFK